ncbi:hypothetical protein J6590_033730 [Homalodisca vitripennis]|nr:hypothetical protein J6590_033730 [Homalodisca vitripennis]
MIHDHSILGSNWFFALRPLIFMVPLNPNDCKLPGYYSRNERLSKDTLLALNSPKLPPIINRDRETSARVSRTSRSGRDTSDCVNAKPILIAAVGEEWCGDRILTLSFSARYNWSSCAGRERRRRDH